MKNQRSLAMHQRHLKMIVINNTSTNSRMDKMHAKTSVVTFALACFTHRIQIFIPSLARTIRIRRGSFIFLFLNFFFLCISEADKPRFSSAEADSCTRRGKSCWITSVAEDLRQKHIREDCCLDESYIAYRFHKLK